MHRHRFTSLAALALMGCLLQPVGSAYRRAAQAAPESPCAAPGGLAAPEALREEWFVIEALEPQVEGAPEEGTASTQVVGLASCRRIALDPGWQLEWDIRFPAQETRVLQVERWTPQGSSLVWRELRPRSGRTVTAEWISGREVLKVREWSGRQRLEVELEAPGGGVLPVHLLELLRTEAWEGGSLRCFDPLSRSFETLRLQRTDGSGSTRHLELLREDGTLAGAWELDGERLVSFQWQAGHLRGRPVEPGEWQQKLEAEWGSGSEPGELASR